MKYRLQINQDQAIDLGIENINQAHIFDLLTTSAVWAQPVSIEKEIFYWVARQKICEELPILNLKPDTAYRHLKSLEKLGLIVYIKSGKRDCIKITNKGKKYHSDTMSEINPSTMSEINPKKLGNKSEFNSEINPTYTNTILYPTTKDTHKEILPKDIITFYYKNISPLQEKIKEIKSVHAMALIPPKDNFEMILIGLENYARVLPADEKYIKSLLNFIQDRTYRDYQEPKEIKATKGNNKTADMIRDYFNHNNDDIEEVEIES